MTPMRIDEVYDSWAKDYDSNLNKTRDLDRKVTVDTLSRYAFKHVLELGCGTGKNTSWLLEKANSVVALDFSEGMLAIAKKKISSNRVHFIQTDLNKKWPVDDTSTDLITSSLTLEHIEDLDPIFEQAQQKLIPEGYFFICELHPFKQYLGSKARFETSNGLIELTAYVHHISDYMRGAKKNNFELLELHEWFDEPQSDQPPRLISFVFKKRGKD